MIDINISEIATEVLVSAIGTAGRWIATAASAPRGRRAEDLSVARWFETYKLTDAVPDLPLSPAETGQLADILRGDAIQGSLQELLAARLTDAPESDAAAARDSFCLTLTLALPFADRVAPRLADFYDDQICSLVARLEASDQPLLAQIRSEALSARMIAVLRAIERHTAALNSGPRDVGTFLASYRRQVIEQHGKLEPPDFDRRRRVPIDDIYVPSVIYEDLSLERTVVSPQPPPSRTVWELASQADRSVLLGDPGGGKTTASNVLMHHFASDPSRRVPFLVTLRDFAASALPDRSVVGHIEHELETFYQCPAPPNLVEMLLLTGRAIVFFDGLDELLDTSRRADVASRLERFCTEYPLAPVLVTSRVVGYDQARLDDQQFKCYRLGSFRNEDVVAYADKWFAQETDARPGEAEAFLSESESVPDLRSNPLLLSLMCILYRGEGSLPRNRAEIYQQCANLLFRRWDARRRIHQDLRAGHLLEPALRHLAWWLFTRQDTHSAVTERELVNVTTEFLHGRGFESEDDARDAAREFIEFCRGRMWVFTDTGTTASGDKLYSFTHRTFLEYFAAAQLAYDSDSPEELARALAPRIVQGEWATVSELAVQIKDSTSTEGARRIYEELLNERRSPKDLSNILQFLARTLRSVDPSPQTIRRLTRETVNFLFSDTLDWDSFRLPLSELLGRCGANSTLVNDELSSSIAELIGSSSPQTHLRGIYLALFLGDICWDLDNDSPLEFWQERNAEYIQTYKNDIIAAAASDESVRFMALDQGFVTTAQALEMDGGLRPLLTVQFPEILEFGYSAYLLRALNVLTRDSTEVTQNMIEKAEGDLTAVGNYLLSHPKPPWTRGPVEPFGPQSLRGSTNGSAKSSFAEVAYLGGAAILLMSVERDEEWLSSQPGASPSALGRFSDLYWYIESRKTGTPDPRQLAALPVPDEFKQVFQDWAAGKVNFIASEANQI